MKNTLFSAIISLFLLSFLPACIEDGFDTSPGAGPTFSVDTLEMGTVFTLDPTPTARFMAYNRSGKILNISSVTLRENSQGSFRINVDGMAGSSFTNVEIRPGDSIYVFVEATLPLNSSADPTEVLGHLDFLTNGSTRTVTLHATAQNVERLHAYKVEAPGETWEAGLPRQIYDSLVICPGATLTLRPGVKLHFHDQSKFIVEGSLVTEGTPESPVEMSGDRLGNVVGSIPFDLMASQWDGVRFAPGSTGNSLSHTIIRNTCSGVLADTLSSVGMLNCRLRNSAGHALESRHATLSLIGCEIADASLAALQVTGGELIASHCTFASYYLFTYPGGPIVSMSHINADTDDESGLPYARATFSNSIMYGLGADFSPGNLDFTDVKLISCVMKSSGTNDDNFINCVWATDPVWATVRNDYYFDYRLKAASPILTCADPDLTPTEGALDFYGTPRLPSPRPGAYQTPTEE